MGTDAIAERVLALVAPHPEVRKIELVGSRATGEARPESDWDFRVEADDFAAVATALPMLCAPLEPLAQQWDRLSDDQCWMLILRGPTKVDLIFPNEPHEQEPPWEPLAENLDGIDAHFWDWVLWLRAKKAAGKRELIDRELRKLSDHILRPLGVTAVPASIGEAVVEYRAARDAVARRLGRPVGCELEAEVAPALG